MQFALSALTLAAVAGLALGQEIQSAPFNLTITSDDGKFTNTPLNACHEGAGIESLCVYDDGASFQFNTTEGEQSSVPGNTPFGVLTFQIPSSSYSWSESLGFWNDFSTNVGHAQFGYNEPAYVSFDSEEKMNIVTYLDDTVTPPTDETATVRYRFFACETNYAAYVYTTVNWVYGNYPPQNPSCVAVNVTREFL